MKPTKLEVAAGMTLPLDGTSHVRCYIGFTAELESGEDLEEARKRLSTAVTWCLYREILTRAKASRAISQDVERVLVSFFKKHPEMPSVRGVTR